MTLLFKLKRSNPKRKRTHKKYPRHKLNNDYTTARNLKEWAYCKHNWNDDDYSYIDGNIKKFLMCNLGKSINKVYSKFLKRCGKLGRFSPKEEFYSWIEKEDNINEWRGGFYLTNGILNYKFPTEKTVGLPYCLINYERFDKLDLKSLLKILNETKVPQYLGKYWVGGKEQSIYMEFTPPDKNTRELLPTKYPHIAVAIPGVGIGIDLNVIYTQTGKIKYSYSLINSLSLYTPIIYFYYLNK